MTQEHDHISQINIPQYQINIPQYVGRYDLFGDDYTFCINLVKKPNWLHRFWTRILLGWVWRDARAK